MSLELKADKICAAFVEHVIGVWYFVPIPDIFLPNQVLNNGVEVKLQRNALSVLEAPTGNEHDDDINGNNSFCSSSDMGEKDMDYCKTTQQQLHFCQLLQTAYSSMSLIFFCSFCASSKHRIPQANKGKSSAYKAMVLLCKVEQPSKFSFNFEAESGNHYHGLKTLVD